MSENHESDQPIDRPEDQHGQSEASESEYTGGSRAGDDAAQHDAESAGWDQPTERTHRFDAGGFAPPPSAEDTYGPGRPAAGTGTGRRGGSRRVVAGALVLGLVGGFGGAAAYGGLVGNVTAPSASSATTTPRATAVSASQDPPAAAGSVEQVAASVLPSVVKIVVQGSQGSGSGSGVVLSADGEILTNNHVVDLASGGGSVVVNFADGSSAKARVLGTDPLTDLAVIKADGVSGLTPAVIGQSGLLDVGENVVAIGSPFGLESTVTSGIVSALARPVSVGDSQSTETTYPAVQTDAAINPGNSGGPLVNMRGEVVGINSSIRSAASSAGESGSIGLGFAIPIDNVLPVVDQLRNGETPTHARLGIGVGDLQNNDGMISGAVVGRVEPDSAAQKAGLATDDVITRVDDTPIGDAQSLVATIRGHRPNDTVKLTVVPGGSGAATSVTATLDSDEGSSAS